MKNENGIEKSAILKGNTMTNYAQITSHNFDNSRTPIQNLNKPLETGKQYTIIINIVSQTITKGVLARFSKDDANFTNVRSINGVGRHKLLYTATDNFNQFSPYVDLDEWNAGLRLEYNQLMIIEGDYTNEDIPYFEGMQSVKNYKTLVNSNNGTNSTNFYINSKSDNKRSETLIDKTKKTLIKPSTRYLLMFKVSNLILDGLPQINLMVNNNNEDVLFPNAKNFVITENGLYKQIVTTNVEDNFNNHTFIIKGTGSEWEQTDSTTRKMTISDIILVEYQEGIENWDIPYFTGMQSVQMPVLTTTGKNLFDVSTWKSDKGLQLIDNGDGYTIAGSRGWFVIPVKVGEKYTLTYKGNNSANNDYALELYETNNSNSTPYGEWDFLTVNMFRTPNSVSEISPFTYTANKKYLIAFHGSSERQINLYDLQLEESSTATSYEPFKSNILSTSEDVELRGIGDVQDTLDCLTGEVTQRVGEIVLDGSENWKLSSNGYFWLDNRTKFNAKSSAPLCDKLISTGGNANYPQVPLFGNLTTVDEFKTWLSENNVKMQYQLETESVKTVDLSIQDQDNQPQERMKLFPTGYINTSSATFPPILELKGVTHNNKLNMTTTNGTNNTQLATLDNLALDGITCYSGTMVGDSYDVESGLYTKRVFRFTIDEDFIERYRDKWQYGSNNVVFEFSIKQNITGLPNSLSNTTGIANNMTYRSSGNVNRVNVRDGATVYITILKEELKSYDVDGLLDWIKRNGAIEVAYQMAEPQIIHMQPNMQPYVSTRPYQGSIESQGNILESSFLDYTSEQSIISPKPLGDGDVLRWEQGSQCYVYENDKEYIPLTDYNQPMGTVLDLEEEDGEQFVENLDGGDIIVDVPFKEKAVYERHLVSHEDNVIYPTQDKLDPTGKIEVDYICGETWQNPNDLSDIRHVGTLREDGQYDVTIRRSGDDEIRLMDGTTHISLDGDGLNPSEFELTFFNSGGVEVGKYGDTSHTLEDCVLDSKLETGTVYGETLFNVLDMNTSTVSNATKELTGFSFDAVQATSNNEQVIRTRGNYKKGTDYTLIFNSDYAFQLQIGYDMTNTKWAYYDIKVGKNIIKLTTLLDTDKDYILLRTDANTIKHNKVIFSNFVVLEGDYTNYFTNYPMDIPYFEGVGSTIVNGFTTVGKNLLGGTTKGKMEDNGLTIEWDNGIITINGCKTLDDSYLYLRDGRINAYCITDGIYAMSYKIIGGEIDFSNCRLGNTVGQLTLTDGANTHGIAIFGDSTTYELGNRTFTRNLENNMSKCWFRFHRGAKFNNVKIQFQLEKGNVATEFEECKLIQYTLPTPITLNKVGDAADTYDVVSGVETRNVTELTFNGSENWDAIFNSSSSVFKLTLPSIKANSPLSIKNGLVDGITSIAFENNVLTIITTANFASISVNVFKDKLKDNPITIYAQLANPQTIQHTLIPSTVETMQEPTFILPQPLRSVPNGICDRLYWDENKGHYCIEKRVGDVTTDFEKMGVVFDFVGDKWEYQLHFSMYQQPRMVSITNSMFFNVASDVVRFGGQNSSYMWINYPKTKFPTQQDVLDYIRTSPITMWYTLETSEIIDLPHLNKKLTLPTQPDTLPIGYKVENTKVNPQLGLTIPYKQLNYPSRPQNIDFKMDIADYVLTWDDVKEARQYNVILNDRVIATVKEPQWNSGEEMYGYIMVEAQNEIAENLSEELYIKTVPNAPAQLTVGHNPMTNYYDFEISFIKTSAIAEYYTVQYRIDGGEWVYKTIQSDEIDPNSKVLWRFSIYEINEQIEVWATATNEIGTNDILPTAIYYMSPTPQWTYRVNSKELFVRWMDESPYDTQYKLRYQYKSDGIYRYAYFEGDKQEIGKLYEALIPLADDEEVSIALCVISEKENLYTKPIKASKELDPNIKPPKNFNYHWLARGLIEFYWEDNYDVDVEYEAIVEHRLTSGNNEWITDTRIFSATDTEGTGTVYRLSYQMEDLEEIRVKVRMKWAMNETEWSESLTTVFIPVEGNPPQWIRRTQTQEGLLVEWEAQEYVDSYHVYIMSNGEELQHLETMDNFVLVDLDYSNTIDIEIYEATRFSGGIQSDPSDKMCFRPTMDKQQMIYNVVTPDTLTYEIEVDTIQKGIKERQVIHDINTTPNVKTKEPMDVAIKSPFTLSYHPLRLDVNQAGAKYYGNTELHIKTLDVKSRDAIEVLTFERITDQYGVDFTVYTPSASKYPITLEVNRVRIVCFGDSLTSGHPGFWAETGTGDPQHCYEYWLDRRLKGQYEIINKGYGSDTTDRMLARFDRDVLANNPQYCIIQGGTNDLYWAMAESMGDQEALDMKLDVMKANIMEMVKRCWDNNIVPIVGNLIPRTGATGIYKTALYDFNAWIISWCTGQAAEGRNIFYVDLFNAGKEAVPPTPIEDPTNPGAMNPIYDGDALFDEFGNIIKQGRGIHLNKEGYRIWAEAIPLSIFKTYDSGLRMYKDLHCTDEDNYDDSDKQNPFYTISIDNVRRSKTKTVVRYVKNIGKTQVLFAMYASDEYNMSIEFVGSDGEKGAYANGLLAPNMIAKVTMEINLDNKDSKASFNLHLAAREYNQN